MENDHHVKRISGTTMSADADSTVCQASSNPASGHYETQMRRIFRRFSHHRLAVMGACVVIALLFMALAADVISPHDPLSLDTHRRFIPPLKDLSFVLGTDEMGRDMLSRLFHGGRISLVVGIAAMFATVVTGLAVGLVSGFYGGRVDNLLMRFTDTMLCFPQVFLLLVLAAFVTPTVISIALIIGLTSWMEVARIIRSQIQYIKEQDFIQAAIALGASETRIMFRELLPNAVAPVMVSATLNVANAVLMESYISFLGYGIQPPLASWGNMLTNAQSYFDLAPWLAILPVTRRDFIKTTGMVTAGAVLSGSAVGMLPKNAWAAKNNVIVGMTQEPVNFNPLLYVNSGTEEVPEACMFDALWDVNEKGEFIPNLAVKVPTLENGGISPDGMVWKIELKQGVKWHDGAPFSAGDVEFTYKTIVNPEVAIRSRSGFDLISEFKIIDDAHVEIILSKPFAWAWQKMHVVPAHILSKEKDINTAAFNTQPVGTGPYTLVKRVAGSHMVYKANPDYHRGAPAIETVIHKFVPDQTVAYTQFKTGEIDVFGLHGVPPERFEESRTLPGRDALETPAPWVEFVYFNCGKPQFQEKVVRQALYYAIDKDRWIEDI